MGVRCTLALLPACNNAGCVYTQKQTILIFLTNELLYRYGIPSITQELWAKLSSTQYAHHVSIYRSQGKPIFQYYVVCFQNIKDVICQVHVVCRRNYFFEVEFRKDL